MERLAGHYDSFLVDQWGVLHDGRRAFPEAVECLRQLRDRGKWVTLVSNSGRPVAANAARLAALGIEPDCYSGLITSGAVFRNCWAARSGPCAALAGRRCLLWSSEEDPGLLDGLDLAPVPDLIQADFILLAGVRDGTPFGTYLDLLSEAARRGSPLLCINPDTVRYGGKGLTFSAGAVARRYEEIGGKVFYIGKPHGLIYQSCLAASPASARSRVVAIGDSVGHDVLGGVHAGLDTVLVTDGVHRPDFVSATDDAARLRVVQDLAQVAGVLPQWLLPCLRW